MTLEEQIAAALAELGATADEAAEALRLRGIRGVESSPTRCPLACYLRPLARFVEVNGVSACFHDAAPVSPYTICGLRYVLPAHLRRFAQGFDRGLYPDLLAQVGATNRGGMG